MTRHRLLKSLLIIILLAMSAAPAGAVQYQIKQISGGSGDNFDPQINDSGQVVWQGSEDTAYQIYLYSNGTVNKISSGSGGSIGFIDEGPEINNSGQVVWQGYDKQIYLYSNGTTTTISNNSLKHWRPQINNNGQVVWHSDGYATIYLFSNGTTTTISNGMEPQINNKGQVVWQGWDGSTNQVYLYSNGITTKISNNPLGYWFYPQINDSGQVVWSDWDGSTTHVYLYSNGTTTKIANRSRANADHPKINNSGQVVWSDWDGSSSSGYQIYLYSDGTVNKISSGSTENNGPEINSSGQVVWSGREGTACQIYLYSNGTTTKLTNATHNQHSPQINDSGQVVWQGWDGTEYQIFLATPLKTLPSVNTHWYNWATTFSNYGEIIKKYGVVRDGAWWEDLEKSDFTTDSAWNNASWSYSRDLTLPNCNQSVTYQSGYDNLVKKFQDPDSPDLVMVLKTDNKNISADTNNITYNQYYDYVQHVVSRYNKNSSIAMSGLSKPVKYYEIGNEPDNPTLNGGLTLSNYVNNRLIPAYRAAKEANPEAIIVNAGLYLGGDGGFDTSYLDNMLNLLKQNGGESNNYYMDILAIHYYYHPQDPESFLVNIDKVRQVMSKYNISSKPLWITEYGVATKSDAGGQIREKDQASVLLRFNCLMKFSNIDNSIIYNLKDVNSANPAWENTYGLYKVSCQQSGEQITAKEAVQVLDTFYKKTNGLNGITINSTDERNNGIYNLTFSNGTKYVNVIWYTKMDGTGVNPNHAGETSTIKISLGRKKGVLSDMYGNVMNDKLHDGSTIIIGERPNYIESNNQVLATSLISGIIHLLLSH